MSTDTLKRFQDEALRVGDPGRKNRLYELLGKIRRDAMAVIGLASMMPSRALPLKGTGEPRNLEQLLQDIRAAAEELRPESEAQIAAVLKLADEAARASDAMWQAALSDLAKDRAKDTQMLRWMLRDAENALHAGLRLSEELASLFAPPLARLDELEKRTNEFPVLARECLARWEMLDRPAPPLDHERIAAAKAAYARGDHEDVGEILSRIQAGGPWVKE
jgi:hypothetical protein